MSSKSNDSSKLGHATLTLDLSGDATCTGRELRDDELQKVSGGLKADSNEVGVAVERGVQKKRVVKFKFEPTSFEFGLSHANER